MYRFERFTPTKKKDVMSFFQKLSLKTKDNLSVCGIDNETLYSGFRQSWKDSVAVCLYHDKQIIAIGKLTKLDSGEGYLSCIVVRDDYQRKGIGSRLIKYFFAVAIMDGMKRLYLEVKKENCIGLAFFKRLGFKTIKELEITYLMERAIP